MSNPRLQLLLEDAKHDRLQGMQLLNLQKYVSAYGVDTVGYAIRQKKVTKKCRGNLKMSSLNLTKACPELRSKTVAQGGTNPELSTAKRKMRNASTNNAKYRQQDKHNFYQSDLAATRQLQMNKFLSGNMGSQEIMSNVKHAGSAYLASQMATIAANPASLPAVISGMIGVMTTAGGALAKYGPQAGMMVGGAYMLTPLINDVLKSQGYNFQIPVAVVGGPADALATWVKSRMGSNPSTSPTPTNPNATPQSNQGSAMHKWGRPATEDVLKENVKEMATKLQTERASRETEQKSREDFDKDQSKKMSELQDKVQEAKDIKTDYIKKRNYVGLQNTSLQDAAQPTPTSNRSLGPLNNTSKHSTDAVFNETASTNVTVGTNATILRGGNLTQGTTTMQPVPETTEETALSYVMENLLFNPDL